MKFNTILAVATAAIVSFTATGAFAQSEKEKKQAEVRTKAEATLNDFYKAEPKLKAEVGKAPGYAVFTTYGLSFLVGGAGGKGIARDNKTRKETFMHMAQASAGAQVGVAESETLIVFASQKDFNEFVTKGWEASAGGSIQAGAGGKSVGPASGGQGATAQYYTLTKNGLQVGLALAGTKYSKDPDLN
jgi:lipid-binding SYLF domain-containing protein